MPSQRTPPNTTGQRRAAWEMGAGRVSALPSDVSAVSAWLRLALGTVTGSGYASIPDVLGATSPAVQGTDANRPVNGTSANGLPIMTFANPQFLSWPLSAANNGTLKNGFACWCKSNLVSTAQNLFVIWTGGGGASANKVDFFTNATTLTYSCEAGGTASKSAFMTANAWHFVTVEYDGGQATDAARCLVTVDGVALATTNTTIPASQAAPTGNAWIGGFSNIQTWIGPVGPNFYALNRQLTSGERSILMNFEQPT
jgi:hypothetical protein